MQQGLGKHCAVERFILIQFYNFRNERTKIKTIFQSKFKEAHGFAKPGLDSQWQTFPPPPPRHAKLLRPARKEILPEREILMSVDKTARIEMPSHFRVAQVNRDAARKHRIRQLFRVVTTRRVILEGNREFVL